MKTFNRFYINFFFTTCFLILFFFLTSNTIAQKIYINEILASNTTISPTNLSLVDYSDWIEIYNSENYEVDLSGYYLSDDLDNPTKWQIPSGTKISANGFICFLADGEDRKKIPNIGLAQYKWYSVSFKLSKAGEEIAIYDPQSNLLDSLIYEHQQSDISFGRKTDGSEEWVYFYEPTPNAPNNTVSLTDLEYAEAPVFSVSGGIYNATQQVQISANSITAKIRYTTDGSTPNSNSTLYTSPISVSKTSIIKARVFDDNKIMSRVVANSYIIKETPTLPIVSIGVTPDIFFDNIKGIYTTEQKGTNVPVSFEFFERIGNGKFKVNASAKISGQASYIYPQKPLTIEVEDKYGDELINYKVFPNRDVLNYTSLYLRNSGTNDHRLTLFRDALQHSLVINQMDVDCQAYRPVMSFINGEYWGIYNLREKLDLQYLVSQHDGDPTKIDYIEWQSSEDVAVLEGSNVEYNKLKIFIEKNSLTDEANYKYVESLIDINEFINYQITQIYCDNINWPDQNVQAWRENKEGEKWRWIILDMDWGFGNSPSSVTNNSFAHATSQPGYGSSNYPWATLFFRKLLENDNFRNEFIQRFAAYLNTVFKSTRVVEIVDSIKGMLNSEITRHIDRWNDDPTVLFGNPPIPNYSAWVDNVNVMRTFAQSRSSYVKTYMLDFFDLSGFSTLTTGINQSGAGKIEIHGVDVSNGFSGSFVRNIPIRLKAIPSSGYKFVKWEGASTSSSDEIEIILSGNENVTAVFESANLSLLPSTITANTNLTKENSPYYADGSVFVDPGVTLQIEAGVEVLMPKDASIFVSGNIVVNGSSDDPVTFRANTESGFSKWGALCIDNGTAVSTLKHFRIENSTNGSDLSKYIGSFSSYRSDVVLENGTIMDVNFPIFIQYGNAEIRNCKLNTNKTSDVINIKFAETAVVEYCEIIGVDAFDTDAIDYDGILGGRISNNLIYNFVGFNSDGIDLGEESKNIIIENNSIYNCLDKGISVGQASTCIIRNNVIVNCGQGVGIKDFFSYAKIDRNTFYGCGYGVAVFEKNFGAGGGSADIVNTIFSKSKLDPFFVDNLSTVNISYSLTDLDNLPGDNNLKAEPLFRNNFRLKNNSPAVNAGDPNSSTDPDGSIADMGAYYLNTDEKIFVRINEIHYNPSEGEAFEFIELYNEGNEAVDLSLYTFSDALQYTFPKGIIIEPDEYLVIAKNAANYTNTNSKVFQWNDGVLPDLSGTLILRNENNVIVDFVSYDNDYGWITSPNGNGPSLEFKGNSEENTYYANWQASSITGGSPGKINTTYTYNSIVINEVMPINQNIIADENGEYNDWFEIYNKGENEIDLAGLYLTDDFSNPTKYKIPSTDPNNTTINPGGYVLIWADEDSKQGALHTNFKLSGSGESIAIVEVKNGVVNFIDSLTFGNIPENLSYGRSTDGAEEFQIFTFPTPLRTNSKTDILNKGILLVNGVSIPTYGFEITNCLEEKAYWGRFPITFWDVSDSQPDQYPMTVPDASGNGKIPYDVMLNYSTIIWLGNNYGGDLTNWEIDNIKRYLNEGGNLILLTRSADRFFDSELLDYIGIKWISSYTDIYSCISNYSGLINMPVQSNQNFNSLFETTLTGSESTLLFTETQQGAAQGVGVWKKPANGGAYKDDGGQFVFISGRPYRYSVNEIRANIEYILEHFFNEPDQKVDVDEDEIVTEYKLAQNYPNPFNPTTVINYALPLESRVELSIYNILGEKVRTLVNEVQSPGWKTINWNGSDNKGHKVSSGIYIYRITAGNFIDVKKMLLLK